MEVNTINDEVTMGGGVAGMLLAGRYRVVRQLGQGGMGSVWLAEDTQLDNRRVAIKMLPSILVANKRAYNQLKAEALVSLKLTHPNVATVRAFEENGGNPFLVVDFIDGQTLDDYLAEKGTLTEDEAIRLLTPVAAALDYAHSKGVVHRDVKPANVMIDKDGTPYVLDFGIAREIQETLTRVTGKLSSGTLLYMSPEQLNGDAPKAAQDVYSFAAMAYECLTGAPPFSRGNVEFQIMNKEPEPLDPHIAISGSVMAGLAKDAAGRPANCAAVLQTRKKVTAQTATPTRRTDRSWIFLTLLMVGLAFVGGGLWWQTNQEQKRERIRLETIAVREAESARQNEFARQAEALRAAEEKRIADEIAAENALHRTAALAAFANKHWNTALDEAFKTDLKDSELTFEIAKCYDEGRGVAKDETKAAEWYRKASEKGYARAQNELGEMYAEGRGVSYDESEAMKWWRKAAEQGLASAQHNLGQMYKAGCGVAKDEAEAVKWYRKAAEQGYARAQNELGAMYADGRGVAKDEVEAVQWFRKAAEQGYARAQYNLGRCYDAGRGVVKDEAEAVKWYRKAAEQGDAIAQNNLGVMYEDGRGVMKNYAEAVKWYRKSVEQGDAGAQLNLGLCYAHGIGVTRDDAEAVKWLRKAVEQGREDAQFALGVMYELGRGVAQDVAEAMKWYRKAAEQGQADAKKALERITGKKAAEEAKAAEERRRAEEKRIANERAAAVAKAAEDKKKAEAEAALNRVNAVKAKFPYEVRYQPYYLENGERKNVTAGLEIHTSVGLIGRVERTAAGEIAVLGAARIPNGAISVTFTCGNRKGRVFVSSHDLSSGGLTEYKPKEVLLK